MRLAASSVISLASFLLLSCADSPQSVGPQVSSAPLGNGPEYRIGCHEDRDSTFGVIGFALKNQTPGEDVHCSAAGATPGSIIRSWIDIDNDVQGVATGVDSSGDRFILVIETNFSQSSSNVLLFTDTTGDGLPDAGSKSTIASLSTCHLVTASLHRSSGTLYVVDPLNSRVLRFGDSDGDKIPNGTAKTTFVENGGVLGASVAPVSVFDAAERAVRVWVSAPPGHVVHLLTDTSLDGIADSAVLEPEGEEEAIGGLPREGESTLNVRVKDTVAYRVEASSTGVPATTLATFVGSGVAQTVALSRSLAADEDLELIEDSTDEIVDSATAAALSKSVVTGVDPKTGIPTELGDIRFVGVGITGQETVEAILANSTDDVWTACTVTASTTGSLTATVPDLSLPRIGRFVFKVTTAAGHEFTATVTVKPN